MAMLPENTKRSDRRGAANARRSTQRHRAPVPIALPVRPGPGYSEKLHRTSRQVRPSAARAAQRRDWQPLVACSMFVAGTVLMGMAGVFASLLPRRSETKARAEAVAPVKVVTAASQPAPAQEPNPPRSPQPVATKAASRPAPRPASPTLPADALLLAHAIQLSPTTVPSAPYLSPEPPPAKLAAEPLAMPTPNEEPGARSEEALEAQLATVPEIALPELDQLRDLEIEYATLRGSGSRRETRRDPRWEASIAEHLDKLLHQARSAGLPIHAGAASMLPARAANALSRGTVDLHLATRVLAGTGQDTYMTAPVVRNPNGQISILDRWTGRIAVTLASVPRSGLRRAGDLRNLFEVVWPREKVTKGFDVVPVIVQVLQVEDAEYRRLLLEELGRIPGREAGEALARRALYDTSPEMRKAAVALLQARPAAEYRKVALAAFRYPWPPVADHAADLLNATRDGGSVDPLKAMLDEPDPALPHINKTTKQYEMRELVRINHMRNCCLCHAPSYTSGDWVPGRVMEPGRPIPREYYGHTSGAFVRAEITFLRQDFSCLQRVINARPWPERQRYDYLLRTRKATPDEIATAKQQAPAARYPQRDAILRVLRHITDLQPAKAIDPQPKN